MKKFLSLFVALFSFHAVAATADVSHKNAGPSAPTQDEEPKYPPPAKAPKLELKDGRPGDDNPKAQRSYDIGDSLVQSFLRHIDCKRQNREFADQVRGMGLEKQLNIRSAWLRNLDARQADEASLRRHNIEIPQGGFAKDLSFDFIDRDAKAGEAEYRSLHLTVVCQRSSDPKKSGEVVAVYQNGHPLVNQEISERRAAAQEKIRRSEAAAQQTAARAVSDKQNQALAGDTIKWFNEDRVGSFASGGAISMRDIESSRGYSFTYKGKSGRLTATGAQSDQATDGYRLGTLEINGFKQPVKFEYNRLRDVTGIKAE